MGIAVSDDTAFRSRSSFASNAYMAIALVFFFGVGLAGGAAYKIYFGDDGGPQVADRISPPPASPATTPSQQFAEKAAPDLARIQPSAPTALAPPPAPSPDEAIKPHARAQSAMQATPPAPIPTPQAAPAPVPYAEIAPPAPPPAPVAPMAEAQPAPSPAPEAQPAKPTRVAAAIPPKKPAMVANTHRPAPAQNMGAQAVALHPPPTAPGNAAGPYRVQFGAFANEDNARRVQWAIEATGLKVEVSQEPGPSGHPLFFLRSPSYPEYAAALSAAQTVQHRVQNFVNAIPIDYAILGDRSALEQQAQR
jgi:hypothetical protein